MAEKYDEMVKVLSLELECDLEAGRRRVAACLGLRPGQTVLEVSVGTGANLPYLAEAMNGQGRIVAADLSSGMLAVARRKAAALGASGAHADAPAGEGGRPAGPRFSGVAGELHRHLAALRPGARTGRSGTRPSTR